MHKVRLVRFWYFVYAKFVHKLAYIVNRLELCRVLTNYFCNTVASCIIENIQLSSVQQTTVDKYYMKEHNFK